jgi:hypothetical protein
MGSSRNALARLSAGGRFRLTVIEQHVPEAPDRQVQLADGFLNLSSALSTTRPRPGGSPRSAAGTYARTDPLGGGSCPARPVRETTPAELRARSFPAGSMGPNVEAACRFTEATGGRSAIGRLDDAAALLDGTAGTVVRLAATAAPPAPLIGDGHA